MTDKRPLVLEDLGGGQGRMREMADDETVPLQHLGGSASGQAVFTGTPAAGRTALGLGTAALEAVGTSGNAVGKLNTANTWSAIQAFTARVDLPSDTWIGRSVPAVTSTVLRVGGFTASTQTAIDLYGTGDGTASVSGTRIARLYAAGGTSGGEYSGFINAYTNVGFRPGADNVATLGSASLRWTVVYAASSAINTSDARKKTPLRVLTEAELAAGLELADAIGVYQFLDAVEQKGEGARLHISPTVQAAIEIFESHGLDPMRYGAICYDEWDDEFVDHAAEYAETHVPAVIDERGEEIEPERFEQGELIREAWREQTQTAGNIYSFRNDEIQYLMIAALAEQGRRDRARLAAIEQALNIAH